MLITLEEIRSGQIKIENVTRCFISPHPDDIAFSSIGSLFEQNLVASSALIITVFSRSQFGYRFSETQNNVEEREKYVTEIRKSEEVMFAKKVGCQLCLLDYPDSSIRGNHHSFPISEVTTHMFEQICTDIETIVKFLPPFATIFAPLNIAYHIDHGTVRSTVCEVVRRSKRTDVNICFYEDLPYANWRPEHEIISYAAYSSTQIDSIVPQYTSCVLKPKLVDITYLWSVKKDCISVYKTQLDADRNPTLRNIEEHSDRFGLHKRFERLWVFEEDKPSVDKISRSLAWVSWEAGRHLGGIGTVIKNLIDDPQYQTVVNRTLLIGPMFPPVNSSDYDPTEDIVTISERLRSDIIYYAGKCTEALSENIQRALNNIENKYGVKIAWLQSKIDSTSNHIVERILIDVSRNISIKDVYSNTLPDFLADLKKYIGFEVGYGNIKKHTENSVDSTLRGQMFREDENNAFEITVRNAQKALIDNSPHLYKHTDNDFIYGLLIAQPAADILSVLNARQEACVLTVQDYFSLPTAYAVLLNRKDTFISKEYILTDNVGIAEGYEYEIFKYWNFRNFKIRTLLYASEIKPIRNLIETSIQPSEGYLGHESIIRKLISLVYESRDASDERNVLANINALSKIGDCVDYRILSQGWKLDRVMAVSDNVLEELESISKNYSRKHGSDNVFYHGNRSISCSIEQKVECRNSILSYATNTWNMNVDTSKCWIATRIARPVKCKAMHRDILLMKYLDNLLREMDRYILFIVITSWSSENAVIHDLLNASKGKFTNVKIKVINQAAWPEKQEAIANLDKPLFNRDDLHRGTDLSLGLSSYESFGLSALEPLSCGALCILSKHVGALGMIKYAHEQGLLSDDDISTIVIPDESADFSTVDMLDFFAGLSETDIKIYEENYCKDLANKIASLLPNDEKIMQSYIERGQKAAIALSWDKWISRQFLPVLDQMFQT